MNFIQRFFFWLCGLSTLVKMAAVVDDRVMALNALLRDLRDRPEPKAPRQKTYVTLRGSYERNGEQVLHGWTIGVDLEPNESASVPFEPYAHFTCERVDILGPAVIEEVYVGNETQTFPKYQNAATLEFKRKCEVGNRINVHLRGTP